jgi:hypothetical protein
MDVVWNDPIWTITSLRKQMYAIMYYAKVCVCTPDKSGIHTLHSSLDMVAITLDSRAFDSK